jgi:putative membrane protein insertion efficiency factor
MATQLMNNIGRLAAKPLLGLVWLYQKGISPMLGTNCRFEPSCSAYAREALREYGGFKGGWMAIRRISRCHPLGGSGYDPVPAKESITETESRN